MQKKKCIESCENAGWQQQISQKIAFPAKKSRKALAMHIDTDESNAAFAKPGMMGEIVTD